ncbi:MAG TPA: hypothetical protein VMH84_10580 [Xanthobacteraceae bacterium]|nr:hypothetical protein [Xanthobacteraceae bacterium]
MRKRRAIVLGVAAAVIVGIVWLLQTPLGLMIWIAKEEMFPGTIAWDGKTAWRRCESAIAGKTSWPATPEAACAAMHLCANEAVLSEEQVDQLTQAIRATPGCQAP